MENNSYKPVLQLKNIHKRFPGVYALKDVSLDLYPGEVHALMGENGAGKSTLIKVISGVYQPDEGFIYSNGNKTVMEDPSQAIKENISVIYQELNLAPNLSIAENIFLGNFPKKGRRVDYDKLYADSAKVMEELQLNLDVRMKVSYLTIAKQQLVEIAKSISKHPKVIIMDEPTSALSRQETENLFKIVRMLKESGTAIIYVSHKLDEIFEICDKVSILRDGEYIGTDKIEDLNEEKLVSMMVGRELKDLFVKEKVKLGEEVLHVDHLSTDFVTDISFSARAGEIIGFSGLMGSGRTELCRGMLGIDKRQGGTITVAGVKLEENAPSKAIAAGIGMVPESRKDDGIFPNLGVRENMTIASKGFFKKHFAIDRRLEAAGVEKMIESIKIKTPTMEQMIINLSGGNQQKVILARWLMQNNLKVLLIDEPTRGIDVGAKSEIYSLLNMLAKQGLCVIVMSSEMPEIISLADRVYVMKDGRLNGSFNREEVTQEKLLVSAT